MRTDRIKSINDALFEKGWSIYNSNFPLAERRTFEDNSLALMNNDFHFDLYIDNDIVVGIICYWESETYRYIEHLAIDENHHSNGYGSMMLKMFINSSDKIVILEIEPITDEKTQRRYNFYERLGFKLNPYNHPLPVYQRSHHEEMNLVILSYPNQIDDQLYNYFNKTLRDVYLNIN